ncbi:MAG: hypothetical protein IIB40_02185 [Candidatus Marinimicrobia bacterium]|nr:hypothetical protein [Candidatus Neomarinimicrobiota bacterium]MCH7954936.1 hypothetical protein [Candidatus Neomarinimicrobiota bacterium]
MSRIQETVLTVLFENQFPPMAGLIPLKAGHPSLIWRGEDIRLCEESVS